MKEFPLVCETAKLNAEEQRKKRFFRSLDTFGSSTDFIFQRLVENRNRFGHHDLIDVQELRRKQRQTPSTECHRIAPKDNANKFRPVISKGLKRRTNKIVDVIDSNEIASRRRNAAKSVKRFHSNSKRNIEWKKPNVAD